MTQKASFTTRVKAGFAGFYNPYSFGGALVAPVTSIDSVGQPYLTYEAQLLEIYRKYEGLSAFGSGLVSAAVDLRTTFIGGNGFVITAEDPEKEFLDKLVQDSNFDGQYFSDTVRYTELEGKMLLNLVKTGSKVETKITIQHIPYICNRYQLGFDEGDYEVIKEVKIPPMDGRSERVLTPETFVYCKTSGLRHNPLCTPTKVGRTLFDFEELDRALEDWRGQNRRYGHAFPYFETAEWNGATALKKQLNDSNWKPGHSLAAAAKGYYMEPSGSGAESIKQEMLFRVRKVSGITGIPPHYLGFPDLLANRATAESLTEQVNGATADERDTIAYALEQIFKKAIILYNQSAGTKLNPDSVSVSIPFVTEEQIKLLNEVYAPLAAQGIISKESVRERVPGIDLKKEEQRIEDERGQAAEAQRNLLEDMNNNFENSTTSQSNPTK